MTGASPNTLDESGSHRLFVCDATVEEVDKETSDVVGTRQLSVYLERIDRVNGASRMAISFGSPMSYSLSTGVKALKRTAEGVDDRRFTIHFGGYGRPRLDIRPGEAKHILDELDALLVNELFSDGGD